MTAKVEVFGLDALMRRMQDLEPKLAKKALRTSLRSMGKVYTREIKKRAGDLDFEGRAQDPDARRLHAGRLETREDQALRSDPQARSADQPIVRRLLLAMGGVRHREALPRDLPNLRVGGGRTAWVHGCSRWPTEGHAIRANPRQEAPRVHRFHRAPAIRAPCRAGRQRLGTPSVRGRAEAPHRRGLPWLGRRFVRCFLPTRWSRRWLGIGSRPR